MTHDETVEERDRGTFRRFRGLVTDGESWRKGSEGSYRRKDYDGVRVGPGKTSDPKSIDVKVYLVLGTFVYCK